MYINPSLSNEYIELWVISYSCNILIINVEEGGIQIYREYYYRGLHWVETETGIRETII